MEDKHRKQHWKRNHPDEVPFELKDDMDPEISWCDNWDIIRQAKRAGEKPPDPIKPKYASGFQSGNKYASSDF